MNIPRERVHKRIAYYQYVFFGQSEVSIYVFGRLRGNITKNGHKTMRVADIKYTAFFTRNKNVVTVKFAKG